MGRKKIFTDAEMLNLLEEYVSIYGITKITNKKLQEFANLKGYNCSYQVFRNSKIKEAFIRDYEENKSDELLIDTTFVPYNANELVNKSKRDLIFIFNDINLMMKKYIRTINKLHIKINEKNDAIKALKEKEKLRDDIEKENRDLKNQLEKFKEIKKKNRMIDKAEEKLIAKKIVNFSSGKELDNVAGVDTNLIDKIKEVDGKMFTDTDDNQCSKDLSKEEELFNLISDV